MQVKTATRSLSHANQQGETNWIFRSPSFAHLISVSNYWKEFVTLNLLDSKWNPKPFSSILRRTCGCSEGGDVSSSVHPTARESRLVHIRRSCSAWGLFPLSSTKHLEWRIRGFTDRRFRGRSARAIAPSGGDILIGRCQRKYQLHHQRTAECESAGDWRTVSKACWIAAWS